MDKHEADLQGTFTSVNYDTFSHPQFEVFLLFCFS